MRRLRIATCSASAARASALAATLVLALLFLTAVLPAPLGAQPPPGASFVDADPISAEETRLGHRARTLLARPHSNSALPSETTAPVETAARVRLLRSHPRLGGLRVLETDGTEDVLEVVKRLAATGAYDYVEPNYLRQLLVIPNDPRFATGQWGLNNTGQDGGKPGADISAAAAWEIRREAPDVIVGVLDTGVLYSHEDIITNLWKNPGEATGRPGFDDDSNGYIDDIIGVNTSVNRTNLDATEVFDFDGHGTHVAGTIGASGNNGKGVTGVAWKTQILPLKIFGAGGAPISAVVAAIDYAIAKKAAVLNCSFGSAASSLAEFEALKRARDAGIIIVAAAGNDSQEITTAPNYPAAYPLDNIVAVAATNRQDQLASFSTYGSGLIELAAPGSSILSLGHLSTVSYAVLSGTSMAAPHVTGAIALLKQQFPGDNYRALINRLLNSVDELPGLNHAVHTNGRLNLHRALTSTSKRPFNDDFARRAVITGEINAVRGSNQYATTEAGEPDHGVPGSSGTLWWSWTAPPSSGRLILTTASSGLDTVLALYTGSSLSGLTRVAFNDDESATVTTSRLTFDVIPGTTYTIAVAGKNNAEGLIAFRLAIIPANDAFAQARLLSGPAAVTTGNNSNASRETGEPFIIARARGLSLWYKWVAPATRRYQVSTYSGGDPVLGIYTGTSLSTLALVVSDNDAGPYFDSLAVLNATAGVTYYIAVDTSSGTGGPFTLSIDDSEWEYVSLDPFNATPAIAADGTIYVGDYFGYIHALNPNGTRKWRYTATTGYIPFGGIAVAPDGTLYTGDDTGSLYALTPAGTLRWRYQTGDAIRSSPAIGADGTVYVKSDDGQLYALAPDSTLKWKVPVAGDSYTSPTIAPDGTLYLGSANNLLHAFTPEGTEKWRIDLGAALYASPAIGADGTLYLGNFDGRFLALRPDGTELWRYETGSPLSSSAALSADGTVYFGSYDTKLYALDAATGAKQWDFATGDIIRGTCPALADDGAIYIGSSDGLIYAVEPDGRLRRTYATSSLIYGSPLIAAGRLYVPSTDAKLYAFQIGANAATTPWPMHRQNLRRLGRADTLTGLPVITAQPAATATVAAGNSTTLSVTANAAGSPLTYQWFFNQVALPGATSATYALPSAQTSNAGTYQVLLTGPGGSLVSRPAVLSVTTNAASTARLVNLAVRTTAGAADKLLIVGLSIGGAGTTGEKPLLLRGVGPTLGAFGVPGVLTDPKLSLYTGTTLLLENDDWGGSPAIANTAASLGAFAYAGPASKDAVLSTSRPAGSYTVQLSAATGDAGVALAEIYEATPTASFTPTTPRLVNVSARTAVGSGDDVLIAGFVVGGTGSKTVLIRAIGPTLGLFGVPGVLADPRLALYAAGGTTPISTNDNWGAAANAAQVSATFTAVGAFPLALETRDAALLVTLPPGAYSAQISGPGTTTGIALVEVYEVP